jgi:hypothetical protein
MSELSESSSGAAVARPESARVTSPAASGSAPAPSALLSPSLFGPGAGDDGPTAYEVKFLLDESQARELAARVAGKLALDPYADPAMGDAYLTTSLYTDTPGFDVYRRAEGYARDKFRVRRYGASGPVFVERKTKSGEKVRKLRTKVESPEVGKFAAPSLNGEWAGRWFHSELLAKRLRPVCRVAYERVAYTGVADGGVVRVTFDRNVRGVVAGDWKLEAVGSAPELLPGRVVCEFKFRTAMPALFRGLVADMGLAPAGVSKYRLFVQSAGLAPVAAEARADA